MVTTTNRYQRIVVHPAAEVRVIEHPEDRRALADVTFVLHGKNGEIDNLLKRGWELIKIITHHSAKRDVTGVAYVMGLPKKRKAPVKPRKAKQIKGG